MWQCGFNVKNEAPMAQPMTARPSPPNVGPTMLSDPFVTVFCGPLTARLHLQYFQCPGIHQPCIEFDGEMITPKEFCFRANKDKQKDWKGSIRAGKRTLRYMMEIKAIEFYNHLEVCSGKCQSRNHVNGRDTKPEMKRPVPVPSYPMRPMYNTVPGYAPYPIPPLHLPPSTFPMQQMQNMPLVPPQPSLMASSPPPNGDHIEEGNVSPTMLAASCVGRAFAANTDENQPPPGAMTAKQLLGYIDTDPLMFWNESRRVGLLGEFVDAINAHVSSTCSAASDVNNNLAQVAPSLSRLIHALNLQQYVISRIQSHQSEHFTKSTNNSNNQENNSAPAEKALDQDAPSQPVLMQIGVPEPATTASKAPQVLNMEQHKESNDPTPSNSGISPSRALKRRCVFKPEVEDVKKAHLLGLE